MNTLRLLVLNTVGVCQCRKSPNASMINGEEWDGHKHEKICLFQQYADNDIHLVMCSKLL